MMRVFNRRRRWTAWDSTASTRVSATAGLVTGIGADSCLRALVADEFLALGTQRHVFLGFLRQAATVVRIPKGLTHHAPDDARTEVIFAVELLHPVHQLGLVEIL